MNIEKYIYFCFFEQNSNINIELKESVLNSILKKLLLV